MKKFQLHNHCVIDPIHNYSAIDPIHVHTWITYAIRHHIEELKSQIL